MYRISVILIALTALGCTTPKPAANQLNNSKGPFFADGVKIGELTPNAVRIWTRLTRIDKPDMNAPKLPRIEDVNKPQLPPGLTIDQVEGAVPGAPGLVRIIIKNNRNQDQIIIPFQAVIPDDDFTTQFTIDSLTPATQYTFTLEAKPDENAPVSATFQGRFKTAPAPDTPADILCTSISCHEWWDRESNAGHKVYKSMLDLHPDFFVHTGDFVYYDRMGPMATSIELARHQWNRMDALPNVISFYRCVPTYFEKDDHDTFYNDCAPHMPPGIMGNFTFAQGVKVHYEQNPIVPGKPYRTFRWGKDLQIWLVEGREFRTPYHDKTPDKTIWGKQQIEWFQRTVSESDATFKILFTPTPMVGPDRKTKKDNYANTPFKKEGDLLRRFIADQKTMFVVTGDRHWQYASTDPQTGLHEYSQGPSCDAHAQGWPPNDKRPEHQFLRVKGGFLSIRISRKHQQPEITFTLHDVDGNPLFSQTHIAP